MILYFTPINIFYSLCRIKIHRTQTSPLSNICYYWVTVKLFQFENTIRPNLEAYPFSMHVCKHAYEESPLKNSKFIYFYPICKITPSSTGNSQLSIIFWNFLTKSCQLQRSQLHVCGSRFCVLRFLIDLAYKMVTLC